MLVGLSVKIGAPVRLTIARDARIVGPPVGCAVLPRRAPPPELLLAEYVYATVEL